MSLTSQRRRMWKWKESLMIRNPKMSGESNGILKGAVDCFGSQRCEAESRDPPVARWYYFHFCICIITLYVFFIFVYRLSKYFDALQTRWSHQVECLVWSTVQCRSKLLNVGNQQIQWHTINPWMRLESPFQCPRQRQKAHFRTNFPSKTKSIPKKKKWEDW